MIDETIPVILKDLPTTIRGFCCLGSDYEPIIIINARMSYEQQLKTYEHELEHIRSGQIYDPDYQEYPEAN